MKPFADHEFTSEVHATVLALAEQLQTILAAYPTEEAKTVRRIAKIGRKTEGFAREALNAAKTHVELIPRGLDVERFERALEQRDLLREQFENLSQLTEKVRTAMTLLGVDVYAYGLDVYSALKRGGTPEVQSTVQRLSRCFERKRRKRASEDPAPTQVPTVERPTQKTAAAVVPPSAMPSRSTDQRGDAPGLSRPEAGPERESRGAGPAPLVPLRSPRPRGPESNEVPRCESTRPRESQESRDCETAT